MAEFGKIEVSLGTLEATTCRVAEAVTPQVQELKEWVKTQPQVHVDESPWLVRGVKEDRGTIMVVFMASLVQIACLSSSLHRHKTF